MYGNLNLLKFTAIHLSGLIIGVAAVCSIAIILFLLKKGKDSNTKEDMSDIAKPVSRNSKCVFSISWKMIQRFLNEASLTVEEGEFLAIIGGNGSGKSTLCKTINGLIPHFYVGEFEGEV